MHHELTFIKPFLEHANLSCHTTYAVDTQRTKPILFDGTTTFFKNWWKFDLVTSHLFSQIDAKRGPATIDYLCVSVDLNSVWRLRSGIACVVCG